MADGRREIVIPYSPRAQFQAFHNRKQRWAVGVCHRRAGKTVASINDLIRAAILCEKPSPRFAYIAPFYSQAKDVAWGYLKQYSMPIPGVEVNESELRVDIPGDRRIRLYGADNYDRLRGLYFDGVVLDEYGDMDPRAWSEVIRPALSDRKGWAVFIGTPKGQNHFAELWDEAGRDPAWFHMRLAASESGLIAAEELADARKAMSEEQFLAEYECSFDAAIVGAYYGREMHEAEITKRIGHVPWQPAHVVHTAWDLGIGDSTAIWFCQRAGQEWHLIDYLENSGVGLDWYAKELDRKPYRYGEHILPHDASAKELGSGKSRVETLQALGLSRGLKVMPQRKKDDSINTVRLMLGSCWFDAEKCQRGINALRNYRREWDEKRKVFHDRPLHDWASHGADAFAELAAADPRDDGGWSAMKPQSMAWVV